jgi:hypothetical protein
VNVTGLIVVMVALGPALAIRTTPSDGQVITAAAHQAQADQVSVLKVEGMT